MASLGDLLRDWHQGAQAVARGDWDCALRLFSSISEPPARVSFNVGCVHLLAGDPEAALRAFDQAVTKDACLAVGFLQRGVANFQLERFMEALSDFQRTLAQLRDNTAIDYTQLGLRFKLQAWEVLFNMAAVQSQLGLWAEAACSLGDAISKGPEGARNGLDVALGQVQKQVPLQPRQVPRGEVFRPRRRHVEHLEPVDFLGKAKVLASALPTDSHGVVPPQPQALDVRGEARPRAAARVPTGNTLASSFLQGCWQPGGPALAPPPRPPAQGYQDPSEDGRWMPLSGEEALQRAWQDAAGPGGLQLQCRVSRVGAGAAGPSPGAELTLQPSSCHREWAAGRSSTRWWPSTSILPRGPRIWPCSQETPWMSCVKVEPALPGPGGARPGSARRRSNDPTPTVDQAWLEGHCDGHIGIFPKSFTVPAARRT
ncbi:NADPH oxidase activator 1 isoform X11 [Bos javanicus]|uniref:NADPH oxidase activator 1 isoform X11 n=1 Tax=Bos javanicus TaxID=9906 RepID=UPI002AA6A503|nr:NADPH oxidase activator 1 isoform X11 [Bos javanicus]